MKTNLRFILPLASFLLLLSITNLHAQAGTLDTTFGNGGKVATVFPGFIAGYISSVVVEAEGKIIVSGSIEKPSGFTEMALARYNYNGTLDSSFGRNGLATDSISTYIDYPVSTVLQSNGKIVISGTFTTPTHDVFAIARFNANGSVDSSFGTNGVDTTRIGENSNPKAIALQTDGKIVVAGWTYVNLDNAPYSISNFVVARYKANGTLDSSFGSNGVDTAAQLSVAGLAIAYAVQIAPDGKIIVAGTYQQGYAIARYNSDGTVDSSFGTNGIVTNLINEYTYIQSIALQSDGKILISGYEYNTTTGAEFTTLRYNNKGMLDSSYGNYGLVTTVFPNYTGYGTGGSQIYASALENNGELIVAGSAINYVAETGAFAMARYEPNGTLDNSFGADMDGQVITAFSGVKGEGAQAMALTPSRIYLGGSGNANFALAAYINDGVIFPVTFLNFDGALVNNEAQLKWSVAHETNNKGFDVEKSMDGFNFDDIGFVQSKGNFEATNNYSFTDVKMLSGANYYRLRQIGLDGLITYSSIIKLDYSTFGWAILGNPISENSWMQLQLDKTANVYIEVVSINGHIVQTINKGTVSPGTYSIPLNLGHIAAGVYTVRLLVNNTAYTKSIIK